MWKARAWEIERKSARKNLGGDTLERKTRRNQTILLISTREEFLDNRSSIAGIRIDSLVYSGKVLQTPLFYFDFINKAKKKVPKSNDDEVA